MNFFRKRPGALDRDVGSGLRAEDAPHDESLGEDFLIDPVEFGAELQTEPAEPVLVPYPNRPVAAAAKPDPTVSEAAEQQGADPFVARTRMAGREDSAPARRRIWDIEAETEALPPADPQVASAPVQDPREEDLNDEVALARAQIAQFSKAGLSPETPTTGQGRAKTRLLGFQSATLAAQDPFAVEDSQEAQPVARFPVGWIVVTEGPGRGASFTLGNGVSSIGRGEDQAISLDYGDGAISRRNHASIAFDDQASAFFLGQGGKSNIVRLNGRPVLSTEDLKDGDTIRIGETCLRFIALCGDEFTWAERKGSADDATQ
ncbi:FHA domain-containing protein [Tropicimonas sp. TH_r6]|uniref:FHA domain-containing protein n=1 Tax=Tropicimonas sp. TH_r6 TaxID=3082085 RepID=UPI00295385F0|nr:FHA domain-containing protein [Tropicimonas sp. TH_r6]MDV7141151.1 FHA domain-containing protein [Tropicimonas sp. TH_r6]